MTAPTIDTVFTIDRGNPEVLEALEALLQAQRSDNAARMARRAPDARFDHPFYALLEFAAALRATGRADGWAISLALPNDSMRQTTLDQAAQMLAGIPGVTASEAANADKEDAEAVAARDMSDGEATTDLMAADSSQ